MTVNYNIIRLRKKPINTLQNPPQRKLTLLSFFILGLISLIFPRSVSAQLPDLGATSDFGMFTSVGALDNTGTSYISGNIGTDIGLISGFESPTVVTGSEESANALTAQCAIDVQAAYDEILAIPATDVGHAPAFGTGETLLVGVYQIAAAGSVSGSLTLDAEGDVDAIFIFKFGGAFTTGASTSINLVNGTKASNIFWIAEGAISMATLTEMKGTLIANIGAITMGDGCLVDGRVLSTEGAISTYNTTISLPSDILLPIDIMSFEGYRNNSAHMVINWITESEKNNDFFTIERSLDGMNWEITEKVNGAGNSTAQINYELIDSNSSNEKSYYRIKQTDFDGNYKYAAIFFIQKLDKFGAKQVNLYPNPSTGQFNLLFEGNSNAISAVHIYDAQGREVYKSIGFQSTFDLSNYKNGTYTLNIHRGAEIISQRFILAN